MLSGEGTGLLRLHSTYRHDLKIYSSDEGRVQVQLSADFVLTMTIEHSNVHYIFWIFLIGCTEI